MALGEKVHRENERGFERSSMYEVIRGGYIVPLLVVMLVVAINAFHVARIATISPIDELLHIDYLLRASRLELPTTADLLSQEALGDVACRGHPVHDYPPCGSEPYDPTEFYGPTGQNVGARHSPYYYLATGVAARSMHAAAPGVHLVTWARALGTVWLLAGLSLAYAAGRRLRLPRSGLGLAGALVALSPSVQHAATTVNPDATAFLAGATVLYAGVRVFEGTLGTWALITAVVGAALFDPTNVFAGFAVAGAFIFVGAIRRLALPVMGVLAGALVAELLNRSYSARAGVADISDTPHVAGFVADRLLGSMVWGPDAVLAMMPPTKGYEFPALLTAGRSTVVEIALVLVVASLVVGSLSTSEPGFRRPLFASGLIVATVAAPLLVVVRYFTANSYFPIPPRYGLSLVPLAMCAVAAVLGQSRAGRTVVGLTALALGVTVVLALL